MDADWSVELGAEDPALEFPWSSPDRSQGYVDLPQHPQALFAIPEAVAYTELAEFLRAVNQAGSSWLTVKCDVWFDEDLGEAEEIYEAKLKIGSYVDLIARDNVMRLSFERHEQWVKSAARQLLDDDDLPVACEFIIRRCWLHAAIALDDPAPAVNEHPVAGFYVTCYLFGYGKDEPQARTRWAEGLRRVTAVLAALAP